jgi:superfamily II DNA or RNA helicase
MKLNISYSSLSTFKKSPLEYYFYKIAKIPPEPVNTCYGDAGNAVHKALENYIVTRDTKLSEQVFTEKISKLPERGMFGETINQDKFKECYERGIKIIDKWISEGYDLIPEEEFELEEKINGVDITITGYVDCIAKKVSPAGDTFIHVLDWKTNTNLPSDGFRGQQEFYTYLYYKKHKTLPRHFHWYMLKTNNVIEHFYGMDTVKKIEKEIFDFIQYIKERGDNASLYEPGDYNHPFNNFLTACNKEALRRNNETFLNVEIYRNKLYFKELKDMRLIKAFDKMFSYEAEGHEYSDKYLDGSWDGRIHFLKIEKDKQNDSSSYTLPIGFYWIVQDFIEKYNVKFSTNYKIVYTDNRNKKVQETKYKTKFKEPPFELRYYQEEAVQKVIEKKIGILALGTSAGKLAIMAEAIKQLNVRSLVIVNRIELVEQTADGFEDYLGVKIGRMYEGTLDINNQITIASVQTISAILKRNDKKLITYLFNVNCLMFDECQNVTDKGFYNQILKYLVNSDYLIGLSGSAWRNYEPETLSMKALVGDIIYSKTTAELEKEGFICPTKTIFIRTPETNATEHLSYHDAYDYYITKNEARNKLVQDIVIKHKENKKILILTKLIEHGQTLQTMIPQSLLINSNTVKTDRHSHFEKFKKERGFVLIGSQQIFSTGINIPDLDMIINVSASKSSIMCIQSIGRVKRKFPGKEFGYYIDFFDNGVEVFSHGSRKRMRLLEEHGNEYNIVYSLKSLDEILL